GVDRSAILIARARVLAVTAQAFLGSGRCTSALIVHRAIRLRSRVDDARTLVAVLAVAAHAVAVAGLDARPTHAVRRIGRGALRVAGAARPAAALRWLANTLV